jgi:chromosome segregation ATPase
MSKPQEQKSEAPSPPLDLVSENKILSYTINIREDDIENLKLLNNELRKKLDLKDKEVKELQEKFIQTFKKEKTIKQISEELEQAKKDYERQVEITKQKEKEFEVETSKLMKAHDFEILNLKNLLDTNSKKIENANAMYQQCEQLKEQIKNLEAEKEKLKNEYEEKFKSKEIKNEIKFSDLKKKMMDNIQDTQKNVTQLNIEYMDVSTKLTLLQNHQLLIELEFQSQQIQELLKKKDMLERKVFELSRDIEIHKEVEVSLAEKNRKLNKIIKKNDIKQRNSDDELNNHNSNLNNVSNVDSHSRSLANLNAARDFSLINNLEKKVMKLEASLKKRGDELNKFKSNFEFLEEKLKNYERKYSGIFYLFDEGLRQLASDEILQNNSDIYINFDKIINGDFSNFSNYEKYALLVVLMKYILPLVNPNDLIKSEYTSHSLDNAKIRYQISKKYLDDPVIGKVLQTNKVTMVQHIRKNIEHLPSIAGRKNKTEFL